MVFQLSFVTVSSRSRREELKVSCIKMAKYLNLILLALFLSVAVAIKIIKYEKEEDKQDFSKIPGIPGHDYPIYHEVPETSFDCHNVPAIPGMYANVETGCQVKHKTRERKL